MASGLQSTPCWHKGIQLSPTCSKALPITHFFQFLVALEFLRHLGNFWAMELKILEMESA